MELTREAFESLKQQQWFKGRIASDSMEPLIRVGEVIVVLVGEKQLKRFDIVVFWYEGKLMCHYLWQLNKRVTPLLMQTKSLQGRRDLPIPPEDYLGKVISHRLKFWHKLKALLR